MERRELEIYHINTINQIIDAIDVDKASSTHSTCIGVLKTINGIIQKRSEGAINLMKQHNQS